MMNAKLPSSCPGFPVYCVNTSAVITIYMVQNNLIVEPQNTTFWSQIFAYIVVDIDNPIFQYSSLVHLETIIAKILLTNMVVLLVSCTALI